MEEQRKNSYDPNEDIVDRMWKRSKNSINLVIVVCNILVFLAVTLTGGTESSRHMMDCGAAYAPLIESGEYYRLFTSMFLHFGIQHLINNMLLLLFLGDYLERAVGKIRYLVIYLGGGLVGNLCSYLHELSLMKTGEAPAVSAGASGAIFSAVGAMLVLLAFRKGRLEDLTFRRMAVMACHFLAGRYLGNCYPILYLAMGSSCRRTERYRLQRTVPLSQNSGSLADSRCYGIGKWRCILLVQLY